MYRYKEKITQTFLYFDHPYIRRFLEIMDDGLSLFKICNRRETGYDVEMEYNNNKHCYLVFPYTQKEKKVFPLLTNGVKSTVITEQFLFGPGNQSGSNKLVTSVRFKSIKEKFDLLLVLKGTTINEWFRKEVKKAVDGTVNADRRVLQDEIDKKNGLEHELMDVKKQINDKNTEIQDALLDIAGEKSWMKASAKLLEYFDNGAFSLEVE